MTIPDTKRNISNIGKYEKTSGSKLRVHNLLVDLNAYIEYNNPTQHVT